MQDFDLVIVGAGVAGLTAAMVAGRHGLKVAVVDQMGVLFVRQRSQPATSAVRVAQPLLGRVRGSVRTFVLDGNLDGSADSVTLVSDLDLVIPRFLHGI